MISQLYPLQSLFNFSPFRIKFDFRRDLSSYQITEIDLSSLEVFEIRAYDVSFNLLKVNKLIGKD